MQYFTHTSFFIVYSKDDVAGSPDVYMFTVSRQCPTVFHSGYTFDQQLYCTCSILFSVVLLMGFSFRRYDAAKYYLFVVLICISLVSNDVEHLFDCVLVVWISSCQVLFGVSCQFFFWVFFLLIFRRYYIIYIQILLLDICITNDFSHYVVKTR